VSSIWGTGQLSIFIFSLWLVYWGVLVTYLDIGLEVLLEFGGSFQVKEVHEWNYFLGDVFSFLMQNPFFLFLTLGILLIITAVSCLVGWSLQHFFNAENGK
jgi:hypothetical protein